MGVGFVAAVIKNQIWFLNKIAHHNDLITVTTET